MSLGSHNTILLATAGARGFCINVDILPSRMHGILYSSSTRLLMFTDARSFFFTRAQRGQNRRGTHVEGRYVERTMDRGAKIWTPVFKTTFERFTGLLKPKRWRRNTTIGNHQVSLRWHIRHWNKRHGDNICNSSIKIVEVQHYGTLLPKGSGLAYQSEIQKRSNFT